MVGLLDENVRIPATGQSTDYASAAPRVLCMGRAIFLEVLHGESGNETLNGGNVRGFVIGGRVIARDD